MLDTVSPTPQPDLLQRLLDPILAGDDVTLFIKSDDGRELLDAAAECLATLRCRTFRAAGTAAEGLTLPVLLAQTIGQPVPSGQPIPGGRNDEFLKRGFEALTTLDGTCDRIVLLISDANTLRPTALRYLQLACRAGANLQLVLAGKRGFLDLLGPSEFAYLRERLATGPIITPLPPGPAAAPVAPQRPRFVPDMPAAQMLGPVGREPGRPVLSSSAHASQRRRLVALTGIGIGMAACVALAIWLGGSGTRPVVDQQAMLAIEAPIVPDVTPSPPAAPAVPDKLALPEKAPVLPEKVVATAPEPPPLPAVVPAPEVSQPPPIKQEAVAPAGVAPSVPAVVPAPNPGKSVGRKAAPAQPRALASRGPAFNADGVAAWEDSYPPPPPHDWQPLPPRQAMSEVPNQPTSYIGTYTTDANGIRVFRYGH